VAYPRRVDHGGEPLRGDPDTHGHKGTGIIGPNYRILLCLAGGSGWAIWSSPAASSGIAPVSPEASAIAAMAGGALDIARNSDVPISTQLHWQLAYQIDTGRLRHGSRLPTVREPGSILHVNPNAVRAVYNRLAQAGYVVSGRGAGMRVTARAPQRRTSGAPESLVAELLRTAARCRRGARSGSSAPSSGAPRTSPNGCATRSGQPCRGARAWSC
jgi:DNA-binding transcriptional regulator YhcF (GntR family)